MRALFESQHVEQALQPLARRSRKHLRDLILSGDRFLPHALEAGVVGRGDWTQVGTHVRQDSTPQVTKRAGAAKRPEPRCGSFGSAKPCWKPARTTIENFQ